LQTVKEEREANERELIAAAEERRRLDNMAHNERVRIAEEQEARIAALEEELRAARAELEAEKQERIAAEAARLEAQAAEQEERHQSITGQLNEINSIVTESQEQCTQKLELCNQRHEEKIARRQEKEQKQQDLFDLVNSIIAEREAEKQRADEERAAAAEKPGKLTESGLDILN
jgi:hypothetical protein